MKKRILISGGGIAGMTAAKLLFNQGHEVTVIDKAKKFTKAGFLISLKSFGVEIMDELGLTGALRKESTPSEYMHWVDATGAPVRSISYAKVNQNTSQSILITRGGLHEVLYNDIRDHVEVLMDTTIAHLEQNEKEVNVTLSNGESRQADLVIISEGLRSVTRGNYFKDSSVEDFNLLYMGGRLKERPSDTPGNVRIYLDVDKMLSVYPLDENEVAIQCYLRSTEELAAIHARVPELLKDAFRDYNADVRHLIDSFLESGLMFADKMGMVHAPALTNGKLVLLGDAGYCPTALSGMGASLSIYGAKALSYFLQKSPDDLNGALQRYDGLMKPISRKFQSNARNNAESFIPDNQAELKRFTDLFSTSSEDEISRLMTDQIALTPEQLNFLSE